MIIKRIFICKVFFTDVRVGMAHRFLMLTEGPVKVEPLISAMSIEFMKGVTVALQSLGGEAKAIVIMVE